MFSFRFCLVKLTTVIFYNILLPRALQSYQAAAHRITQSIDLLQITEALTCWLLILDSCYSMDSIDTSNTGDSIMSYNCSKDG